LFPQPGAYFAKIEIARPGKQSRSQGALKCGSLLPLLKVASIFANQLIAIKAQASLRTPRDSLPRIGFAGGKTIRSFATETNYNRNTDSDQKDSKLKVP
jgi:hypothetical protein